MKAAPACILLITFLSSSLLFSQENISVNKNKIAESTILKSVNHETKLPKEKLNSYTNTSQQSISKTKKTNSKTKATLEMTKTIDTSVPRTTLDFF
ncbi:hypothetical protein [uncultured Aquimarina sp.]|uniref:hypothetical protein n=1 Tax=uncultured Aquimarina sp. TaxID=575652 RepID=UPI0026150FE1|nr:hypothetical protein [uncultured Aquimarina sp.]